MVDVPGPAPLRGAPSAERTRGKIIAPVVLTTGGGNIRGKSLPQLVSLANELASGPPPLDFARIAQIRAAISTGSYRLDPDQIARALLGSGS